jgi:hypothetical protein
MVGSATVATAAEVSALVVVVVGWLIRMSTAAATMTATANAMIGASGMCRCVSCLWAMVWLMAPLRVLSTTGRA